MKQTKQIERTGGRGIGQRSERPMFEEGITGRRP